MEPYHIEKSGMLYNADCLDLLRSMTSESVNCCITSPPYWGLRDYGVDGQMGLEATPEEFVENMVAVFREVRRVLRSDGTLWLNLGDSYSATGKSGGGSQCKRWERCGADTVGPRGGKWSPAPAGLKPKNLVGIPWRVALALQADGWFLRQDIIWHKPNPMPESVKDRCTKAHEYLFLLSKSPRYHYDHAAIKEPAGDKGNANNFRGGAYCNGNKNNGTMGKRTVSGNSKVKVPAGWDTGKGAHGNFHKNGRGGSAYSFARKTATEGKPGSPKQHREDRENVEYFGTRNKRSVWTIATKPFPEAHFATFPPALVEPCVLAGCPEGGVVLDPFTGAGTVWVVAREHGRDFIGAELNPEYCGITVDRIRKDPHQMKLFA